MYRFIVCLTAFGAATAIAHARSTQPADFLFTNGKVYTADDSNPWAEAVAVRGSAVGLDGYGCAIKAVSRGAAKQPHVVLFSDMNC